jgi:hypothetical protein
VKECIMRRVPLLLLTLLPFTTMASEQATVPFDPTHPTTMVTASVNTLVTAEMVVARLMTFDRDRDGRVTKSELPERMQNLLAGDVSGDDALDSAEIRALARSAPPAPPSPPVAAFAATVPGFRGGGGGGGYTFGDQVSLSTRSHVEGALDDLRLHVPTRARALDIVRPFMARLEADASAVLLKELEGVLPPKQLDAFKRMLDRQMSSAPARVVTRPDGSAARFFMVGPDPRLMISGFALPPEQTRIALAAMDGFKARIRPADADRAALLDELKGVLSNEERENFGAALQRRPLVKANQFAGIASGVLERRAFPGGIAGGLPEVPAVRRLLLTEERPIVEP